jgi:hypothetical protein
VLRNSFALAVDNRFLAQVYLPNRGWQTVGGNDTRPAAARAAAQAYVSSINDTSPSQVRIVANDAFRAQRPQPPRDHEVAAAR